MNYRNGMRLILGFQTLLMGIYCLCFENLLYPNYYLPFTQIFDDLLWSLLLIFVGSFVLISGVFKKRKLRLIGLGLMQAVWSFYLFAFMYEQFFGKNNTEWVLALGLVVSLYFTAWVGDV